MYFHLIGIKEKNGEKHDLDLLLEGGDEGFIRKFLSSRGVVIVSVNEFKEDPKSFGNIVIIVSFENTEIKLLINGDNLEDVCYSIMFLGLRPTSINFADNPIPDEQVKSIIDSTLIKILAKEAEIKKQQELLELSEQKKYEESGIKDGLRVLNANIDHIEQVVKAGKGIISPSQIKELEDYSNEMKKIRLGTNFNKMAALVLEVHTLLKKAEEQIFSANDSNKFLIDKNSSVTNIDVLRGYFEVNRVSDKSVFQITALNTRENFDRIFGSNAIILRLFKQDLSDAFDKTSFDTFFEILINLIEYMILIMIVVILIVGILGPIVGVNGFSIYLLPALGWLGLLVYLLNNLELKGPIAKIIGFAVLVLIYWRGLVLLLNTFAL